MAATSLQESTHLEIDAEPRYWEDASVNGVDDSDGTLIPGRDGDAWKIRIDLAAGRIEDWPEGTKARIHYKVCDQGLYWLTTPDGIRVAQWKGSYVPVDFLNHGRGSGSDYIVLDVSGDGIIADYRQPGIEEDDWTLL